MLKALIKCGLNTKVVSKKGLSNKLSAQRFVVTGTLTKYSRDQIHEAIEQHGGQTSASITKSTDYLIAGTSSGSKLKKANSLGVKVISEKDFERMIHE